MKDDSYAVALVFATSHAIKLERMLNAEGIPTKLVPVPRHLSSDCGVCVRFSATDLQHVRKLIIEKKVALEGIYTLG